jgi:flagellar hook-associated protein 3 FlgL
MRVTENIKRDQVLGNIQKNSQKLQDLQIEMASGQRINKTSDDPVGATLAQDIVTNLSKQQQRIANLADSIAWLERNEVELNHISELMDKAKSLAMSQATSSANPDTRRATASEIAAIRESLYDSGNAREGKLYLFSGVKSLTPALKKNYILQQARVETEKIVQRDIRDLVDVTQFQAQFEGFSQHQYVVKVTETGYWGKAKYQVSDDGGQNWGPEKTLRPVIDMYNPEGKENDKVRLKFFDERGELNDKMNLLPDAFDFNNEAVADFDVEELGPIFPEGLEFVFTPNPPVSFIGSPQKKETLIADGTTVPINVTADELLLGVGEVEVDTFSLMLSLERALETNDGTAIAEKIQELELALEQVLKQKANVGNTVRELREAQQKQETQIFDQERRLSEIRDSDLAEAAVNLRTAELNNRVSLDTGSRLIQPSLTDFLR